jgi:luciferase family oxidoreductase group 1
VSYIFWLLVFSNEYITQYVSHRKELLMNMKLSVLDQSPVSEKGTATEALHNTVTLAQQIENMGYTRFWVSEHHNALNLAGSSPEILISYLAAKTSRIRLGSGGVMLPNYSSYKVAENFRVLEALAPGRIDLGIGKAPGGMPLAVKALNKGQDWNPQDYPKQIDDLMAYLNDSLPNDHPYSGLKATPLVDSKPELWLLSSGGASAQIAAKKGLSLNYAHFINPNGGPAIVKSYKDNFMASHYNQVPKAIVSIYFVCAQTEKDAEEAARSVDLNLLLVQKGMQPHGIPSKETAKNYPYSQSDWSCIKQNRQRVLVGTPEKIKDQLLRLQNEYEVDEFMLVSLIPDINFKIKSYELIANEFKI